MKLPCRFSVGVMVLTWRIRISGVFPVSSGMYFFMPVPVQMYMIFSLQLDLDADYRDALLRLNMELENRGEKYDVALTLNDRQGNTIFSEVITSGKKEGMDTVCIEKKILNPLKWTAETPNYMI